MTVTVYGLIDPTTRELRYIGQTHFSLEHRLKGHLSCARSLKRNSPVVSWLRKLAGLGLHPDIFEIETQIANQDADIAEIFYIEYYRYIGCRLTNHASGGRVNRGFKHTAEWSAKASLSRKGISGLSNKGKRRTPEQKARISAGTKVAWTKHPHPQKGRHKPQSEKDKIRQSLLLRTESVSNETRRLLSENSLNLWKDAQYRDKVIKRGEKHPYFGKSLPACTLQAAHAASRLRKGIPKSEEHKQKIRESVLARYAEKRASKANNTDLIKDSL